MESRIESIVLIRKVDYTDFLKGFFGYNKEVWDKLTEPEYEEWFKNLWDACGDEDAYWDLYKAIKEALEEESDFALFDRGWQYRNVLSEDYDDALAEFHSLLFGWW